ncbi:MAG: glycoside hydrolase family 3 protein [Balneolaceae bacterium]|nr:MAG: glycoside hydrolase family 3 protein [Balneolaceae bacterium]
MAKIQAIILTVSVALFSMLACSESSEQVHRSTLDEQIGQMLMVGFKGFEVADTSHIIRDIQEYHAGGIILFDYDMPTRTPNRNIDSPEQVKQLIADLQSLTDVTLFMAVDQEGGRVARLKTERGFANHVSADFLGALNNPDSTRYYAAAMAKQLNKLGFNVNFAPVVDLNTNPENPVIGRLDRSFGADPELVTIHSSIFLEEFTRQNVLGVLKHFPGHGSAWNDSHVGMADVTDTWEEIELLPYKDLAKADLPFAVMTAHVFNENLDTDVPATLSKAVQTGLLREEIGFNGVLFSDDMQMDAIRSYYGLEMAVENAILAGVDVLVFANNSVYDPDIVPRVIGIIKDLIEEGAISEERIQESYNRIMAAKNSWK